MTKIFGYFLKGLLIILPIFVILYIVRSALQIIIPVNLNPAQSLIFVLSLIAITTLAGAAANKGLSSYVKHKALLVISKFPLLSKINLHSKKLFLILNFSKEIFNEPVMIKRENGREIKLGFITKKNLKDFNLVDYSSVYIPNPFSFLGELTIIENKHLEKLQGDKREIVNFILSGGLINKEFD